MTVKMEPLPPGWCLKECKDYPGRAFYYNEQLNFSTWHRPPQDYQKYFYLQIICIKSKNSVDPFDQHGKAVTRTKEVAIRTANRILKELQTNPDQFTKYAKQYSDLYTEETCGTTGWVECEDFKFFALMGGFSSLKVGEVSGNVTNTILGSFIFKRLA